MRIECPGKLFILGEYACLQGKPALLVTLEPRFSLKLAVKQDPIWTDPYPYFMGVGSSSAQFLLSFAYGKTRLPPSEVLQEYWACASGSVRPSGVDVLAQLVGGPVLIQTSPLKIKKLAPWKGKGSLFIAYTGKKIKTYKHLKTLAKFEQIFSKTCEKLAQITQQGVRAWLQSDSEQLGHCFNVFQNILTLSEIAPKDFALKIQSIQKLDGVYGCKGSGSQGGDCVILLIDENYLVPIEKHIQSLGWKLIRPKLTTKGLAKVIA